MGQINDLFCLWGAGDGWKIAEYAELTAEPGQAENMMAALDSAKKVAEEHEEVVRQAGVPGTFTYPYSWLIVLWVHLIRLDLSRLLPSHSKTRLLS